MNTPLDIACVIHNPAVATFFDSAFRNNNFHRYTLHPNASSFVATLGNSSPRIVISERHFDDGFDAKHMCELIRLHYQVPYIYLILLSTSHDLEDIADALNLGFDDYLIEPFFPQQIHARLMVAQKWITYLDHVLSIQRPGTFTIQPPPNVS